MENITTFLDMKLIPKTSLSNQRCDECQRKLHIDENEREFCWHCETIAEEDKQLASNAVANREKDRLLKMFNHFEKESLINPKLLKATFDNYKPENDTQDKAKAICMRYAEKFSLDNPQSPLLIGKYGVGKSHLSVAITKAIMQQNISTLFISVPRLLTKIKSTFKNPDVSEIELLQMIERVQLLVLDDIGAESDEEKMNVSSWAKSKIFEVVESRIGKHTIFTSNLNENQLMATYGERNASRILEDSTRIYLSGENYRLKPR